MREVGGCDVFRAVCFRCLMGGWTGVGAVAVAAMLEDKTELWQISLSNNPLGPEGADARWRGVGGGGD